MHAGYLAIARAVGVLAGNTVGKVQLNSRSQLGSKGSSRVQADEVELDEEAAAAAEAAVAEDHDDEGADNEEHEDDDEDEDDEDEDEEPAPPPKEPTPPPVVEVKKVRPTMQPLQ